MIVGNGMIAGGLHQLSASNPEVIFFASGVSNSKNVDPANFLRERLLLERHLASKRRVIYFSTMSIYDELRSQTSYAKHKLEMESLIIDSGQFTIFRLPEVVGKPNNNSSTVINFLYEKILAGSQINLWKGAQRNLIDVVDVSSRISNLLNKDIAINKIVNICSSRNHDVIEILQMLEKITLRQAKFVLVDNSKEVNKAKAYSRNEHFTSVIETDHSYLEKVLRKYYS